MAGILRDSLSNYTDDELLHELRRRTELRAKSLCSFCDKPFTDRIVGNNIIYPCTKHERAVDRIHPVFLIPAHPT